MSAIRNARLFFHQQSLKKQLKAKKSPHPRKRVNLSSAQTVGILFDATELDNRKIVLKYAKELKGLQKKVSLLGFFDSKVEDENYTFKHINLKHIDWALRPMGEDVKAFMAKTYDVFINADPRTQIYSEYIAALSDAHLKVGPCTENTYCYDVMIDLGKSMDLNKFLQQVDVLMKKTNTRHEAAI